MYNYIKGTVEYQGIDYIVLENNGIGYNIFVPNPYLFELHSNATVYTYQKVAEDENSLYGFKEKEEKELFLKLINVKGVGPKTVMPMLQTGSVKGIIDAIDRENILYLKKFPKVGEKAARQIILDLKGKLAPTYENKTLEGFDELVEALESLGYKLNDIKKILPNLNINDKVEKQIKEALRLIAK